MALLMMLSSTGFSMNVHYCQDQIKDICLFRKAKSCHEKQSNSVCCKANTINRADKDKCCHNETIVVEKSNLDATLTQLETAHDIKLEFSAAFVESHVFNYNLQPDFQTYKQYKPPLPERDLQVLYQTFLI